MNHRERNDDGAVIVMVIVVIAFVTFVLFLHLDNPEDCTFNGLGQGWTCVHSTASNEKTDEPSWKLDASTFDALWSNVQAGRPSDPDLVTRLLASYTHLCDELERRRTERSP